MSAIVVGQRVRLKPGVIYAHGLNRWTDQAEGVIRSVTCASTGGRAATFVALDVKLPSKVARYRYFAPFELEGVLEVRP